MTARPWLHIALLALLPACAIAAAHPSRARRAELALYRTYMKNGAVLSSSQRPLVGFGEVRLTSRDGSVAALPLDQVDLDRSRTSWEESHRWASLDNSGLTGQRFPDLRTVRADGEAAVLPALDQWTLVELYRSYCLPCHAQLVVTRSWLATDAARGLNVVAVCIDCSRSQLLSIVADRKLDGAPRFTNARLEREPEWLTRDMAGAAKLNFIVSPRGEVVNSNMLARPGDMHPDIVEMLYRQARKEPIGARP